MRWFGLVCAPTVLVVATGCPNIGLPSGEDQIRSSFETWNRIAVDTSGLDHSPVANGEDREFGHQLGPVKSSRAMAIVHIAMFDAANAIAGGYNGYAFDEPGAHAIASVPAAVAQAAHDTLVATFPSHAPRLGALLEDALADVPDGVSEDLGVELGAATAAAILALRANDNSDVPDEYEFSDQPGMWRVDPINPGQKPLGPRWGEVEPFALESSAQFRCPEPPALDSAEYADAYSEVFELGGDGVVTPTNRTEEGTQIGIYWAYDGTPSLCAPPRLYNQIATLIADQEGLEGMEFARVVALVNVAMADAGIASWESKYYYNFWRPVTGIREADEGAGPTGDGDGNPDTIGDRTYVPLCAPASNLAGKNFTPPFPSYPSGHATFGGALFQTLRRALGRDDIAFTFVSDEYNGETVDSEGNVRPLLPRSFDSLSQAEEENGQSRIYLGIHWSFDKTEGIVQGRKVADYIFDNVFAPRQ